jgi:nicotinamidase-related amidase
MNTIIDKTKTALVVIDLQKGIAGMATQPHPAEEVVANAALLADAFRKNGMLVVLVRVAPSADRKDMLKPILDIPNPMASLNITPEWSEIVPQLGPKDGDLIVTKKQWGAFYGTDLDLQLRRRNIDTVVLCGISTSAGVESTARSAFEHGYQQIFVEDATSARAAGEHEYAIKNIFPRIGRVRLTNDILEALK